MTTAFRHDLSAECALTITDLQRRFGALPLSRLRTDGSPGTATEDSLLELLRRSDSLYELVDGILLEKALGAYESLLAGWILTLLNGFVRPRRLGAVFGADAPLRLRPGLVRVPDVSFISRDRLPGGRFPRARVLGLTPNLVVEVLSQGNTDREMREKLQDYFSAGVELVWYVDPRRRCVEVYTGVRRRTLVRGNQTLSGGRVLAGFEVRLHDLFAELDDDSRA